MYNLLFIEIYRSSFESSETNSALWDDSTIYLYGGLILFIMFIGWVVENGRNNSHIASKLYKQLFFVSGIVMTLLLGLRGNNVGVDTMTYRDNFEKALLPNAFEDETTEPGYQLALRILNLILPNTESAIFLFSAATVVLVFATFWKQRKYINMYIALSFYVGMYFFQAMNLMRIYLAAAFLIYYFHLLIEERYKKYSLIILIASLFHYSSLVLFLPLLFLYLYKRSPRVAFACILLAIVLAIPLSRRFGDFITIARYAAYAEENEAAGGVGIMLLFDFLPCIYFLYYIHRYHLKGQWADLLVCFTCIGFFIKIVSYYISIAGRLGVHFMPLFVLLVPYFVNHVKTHHRKQYPSLIIFLTLYLVVRVHFYFIGYLAADGVMPYYFFWSEDL